MIIGHERQLHILNTHLERGAVSHAYLFSGAPCIGKYTVARLFAKNILCRERKRGVLESCEVCEHCVACENNAHPDVVTVLSDKISIGDIRALKNRAGQTPLHGSYKIFIIKDAGGMSREAANSFLKLLEEPPGQSVFLLVSSSLASILPTILSRMWHLKFWPTAASLAIDESRLQHVRAMFGMSVHERFREISRLKEDPRALTMWYTEASVALWREMHSRVIGGEDAYPVASALRRVFEDMRLLEKRYVLGQLVLESTLFTHSL